MSRTSPFCFTACLALFVGGASTFAADPATFIAPYLGEDAVAVARVDLTKVDVAAGMKFLEKNVPITPQEIARTQAAAGGLLASLRAQKVSEMYLVFSLADLPQPGPFAIVPVGPGGDHRKVAGILFGGKPDGPTSTAATGGRRAGPFQHCKRYGDVVFCGTVKTLERLKSQRPVKRPQLATAFQAVDGAAMQFVLAPSKDHRRVLAELMPRLPKEYGGMDGKQLAKAVQWAAIGVRLPPKPKADVVVTADSQSSAKRLKATYVALARTFRNLPVVKHNISDLETFAELLKPTVEGNRFTLTFDATRKEGQLLVALFSSAVGNARAAAQRSTSKNNLKQLGLAMHNFHDVYRGFPPHASYDKTGKRLLSWRVYLLPFLGQKKLFDEFHLDEPWDSRHNKTLIARMPKTFADPGGKAKNPGTTRFLAPIGPKNVFDGKPIGIRIRDITDGTSNTIMIVEAAPESAVVWTKPDDVVINAKDPLQGLLAKDAQGFQASFADGSVRLIAKSINLKILRALFTRNGGEVVGEF